MQQLHTLGRYKKKITYHLCTAALSQIIREHQHRNDIPPAEFFAKEMAKQIAEELKTPLTRIRLGVNNADRNSDILLLLVNNLLAYLSYRITQEIFIL
jgi:Mg2+ and Co2+ transporter CorA